MTSTYTQTETRSFTITEARHIASKIASDLNLLTAFYSNPSLDDVEKYKEEAAQFIAKRYLKSVEYGYKKDGAVVFSLKYTAKSDGTLSADDRPGKVPAGLNTDGIVFYSYLRYSDAFFALSESERNKFESGLPVRRTTGGEPVLTTNGYWEKTHTYSKNGEGVEREVFKQV